MKIFTILMLLVAIGCSKNPASPSLPASSSTLYKSQNIQVSGPGLAGCVDVSQAPGAILEWSITDVPLDAKIDKAYGHDDTVECKATIQNLRTDNDHLRVVRDSVTLTTLRVFFDRDTYDCGHVQVDVSVNGVNVLGSVMLYGKGCTGRVEPPAIVPPVVPPFPPTECWSYLGSAEVNRGTATFTILPGGLVELSFLIYIVPSQTFLEPEQEFYAGSGRNRLFGPGTHTVTLPLPERGWWQSDLYCGSYDGANLSWSNYYDYAAREIAADQNWW